MASSISVKNQQSKGGKDIVLRVKKAIRLTASIGFISTLALAIFSSLSYSGEPASAVPEVPTKGMVTMVDIGAKKCIPCKMMAPIMEELEKEYKGKAAIIFIDVWADPSQGRKFSIRSIPTQIFYDREGKEVMRHEGFFEKKAIVAELEKLGVK
jgi:thioredoxin 1